MESSQTQRATLALPLPRLDEGRFASVDTFTDEALFQACGVRIAFTMRQGGVSEGAYDSLNLGIHVNDDPTCVHENRRILMGALGCASAQLIVPNQVHGDEVLCVSAADQVPAIIEQAAEGCDAVSVSCEDVAALLCFADCVPVIAVAPTGAFSVIHAGWRGVDNQIAAKAVRLLAQDVAARLGCSTEEAAAQVNVYIGPHIHGECFETSEEIHDQFVAKFGESCSLDSRHVVLAQALRTQLGRAGVVQERICDLDVCTVCENERFFSYRAQGGVAGRHGAFACKTQTKGE